MAAQRKIRNTWLDPFRFSIERKADLALLRAYKQLVDFAIENLQAGNRVELPKQLKMAEQVGCFGQFA